MLSEWVEGALFPAQIFCLAVGLQRLDHGRIQGSCLVCGGAVGVNIFAAFFLERLDFCLYAGTVSCFLGDIVFALL